MLTIRLSLKGAERPAENDDAVEDSEGEECEHDIRQEMRRLSETSESRRLQVFQTNKQLKEAQETLMELRKAIKLKVCTNTGQQRLDFKIHLL